MANLEEKNTGIKIDPYLESPKAFHLEMPLYHTFDLSVDSDARKIYEFLHYSGTLDAYCIWCDKESVFDTNEHVYATNYYEWLPKELGFIKNSYTCSRNRNHEYHVYYLKTKTHLLKIGQWPSVADFQIPQAEKYRKILGEEEYREFTRGIGLSAHGVGIGSFVYLRRVFENLIEEAYKKATEEIKDFPKEGYLNARMDEKIKMVKDYLPEFLVENRSLYAILSKGIHDLSEDECLQYFETVKIGIEQVLDEKIIKKERAGKAAKAREAISKVHGKLSDSKE